jgi:hypothetical protein
MWRATLYPTAGEAGGSYAAPSSGSGAWGAAVDAETAAARSLTEAARRAGTKARRYCVANGIRRLGTLTYAGDGCFDPGALRRDVADFFRELRAELGEPFPYLWVPEWHLKGHGLHAHFGLGRYVRRAAIVQAWGHGFIDIRLLGDMPVGSGRAEQARKAASYLGKYVAKTFATEDLRGRHRYEVAQGFQPTAVRIEGRTDVEILERASEHMGAEPSLRWYSNERPEWRGPPALWFQWATPL